MRHLRLLCASMILICAFAFSAYAGNIECDGLAAPSQTVAGEMPCPVTDAIAALVESMLSLI
jgi:hypothetical protein